MNILVIIKEKLFKSKQKVIVRIRKEKSKNDKEFTIEEFSYYLSRIYRPNLKPLNNSNTVNLFEKNY